MKELIARIALIGIAVVVQVVPQGVHAFSQDPPHDFAIRLKFGTCTTDTIDTFEGVFIRDLGRTERPVSIKVDLPTGTLRGIYREVVAARVQEYPEEFRLQGSIGFGPAMYYHLTTRHRGAIHSVSWRDSIRPSTDAADRLRSMFERIIPLVMENEAVKRLPRALVGCGEH